MSKRDKNYTDNIESIRTIVVNGEFENIIEEFDKTDVETADESLRKYGAEAGVNNLEMPDRMIGMFKLMFEMEGK